MPVSTPVILILGYGPNISHGVAQKFFANGYSVAVAARSLSDGKTPEGFYSFKADFSNPTSVPDLFAKVIKEVGNPQVVIYNAVTITVPKDDDIFSLSLEDLNKDTNVNTWSSYIAAQQAVKGFDELPRDVHKTFIYTGNVLAFRPVPMPFAFDLAIAKAASWAWIGMAAEILKDKDYKFFYADERKEDGSMAGHDKSAVNHSEFYWELATDPKDIPWEATFTGGKGYVKYEQGLKLQ